jgi:hypothetical protein
MSCSNTNTKAASPLGVTPQHQAKDRGYSIDINVKIKFHARTRVGHERLSWRPLRQN